ncbi:MAG: transcriptional regulator [Micavibrio sp.]|nr:transcriptional regulator [Micavibrio sp.]|tara:strand:- start:20 stop:223 length:204 start_codon:yes stop_codon:yes gene_type:complete
MATIKTIGSKIAEARKLKGLTQEQLAIEGDIDRSYISDIENGKANITVGLLLTICSVLQINPKILFE